MQFSAIDRVIQEKGLRIKHHGKINASGAITKNVIGRG